MRHRLIKLTFYSAVKPCTRKYPRGHLKCSLISFTKSTYASEARVWQFSEVPVPMSTYPEFFFPSHKLCCLIDISSAMREQIILRSDDAAFAFKASNDSSEKPGSPLILEYHFDNVLGCGRQVSKVALT